MSTVHVYIGFWTDHSCIETWVDENQLVRVESSNFVRVVRLRLIHITGFSVLRRSSVFQLFSNRHGPKLGRWLCPFSRGRELGNHLTQCRLGRSIPSIPVPSAILIHAAVWPQYMGRSGACAPFGGAIVPHVTQCGQGRGLPACQVSC